MLIISMKKSGILNHLKRFHGLFYSKNLLFRASRLSAALGLWLVIILPLYDSVLPLHLGDIQVRYMHVGLLLHIISDLVIGCRSALVLHKTFHVHVNVNMRTLAFSVHSRVRIESVFLHPLYGERTCTERTPFKEVAFCHLLSMNPNYCLCLTVSRYAFTSPFNTSSA